MYSDKLLELESELEDEELDDDDVSLFSVWVLHEPWIILLGSFSDSSHQRIVSFV